MPHAGLFSSAVGAARAPSQLAPADPCRRVKADACAAAASKEVRRLRSLAFACQDTTATMPVACKRCRTECN
eukprot:662142-Pleurochrysis_carterae.AAC.1